jgi:hypothetical protein
MFQQTYFITNISEKNPVEIRYIAGVRATLTHMSAAAEGRLEIELERDAEETGRVKNEAAGPSETLVKACLENGLRAFNRIDFPCGQFPRLINGDGLRLKLSGRAKSVCLVLSFAEG